MRAFHLRSSLRHGPAWLVWLALLLPMAQSAAVWHGLSHFAMAEIGHGDDQRAAHAANCDLCLTAAAVSGGALLGADAVVPLHAVQHAPPQAAVRSVWPAFPPLAYLSRAPPLFLL